ncbi:MAG: hypothetical protein ACREO1_12940 [Arenimonas sp.]
MSAICHFRSLQLSVLVSVFLMAGCTHDNVSATTPTEPAANTPSEPAAPPTVPEASPPTEPTPATPTEPVATTPAEPVPAKPTEPKANDTFTLKPGQSATVGASTKLHYARMVSDSRCPANVQCIWAGEVTIELMLESGKEKQTFTMKDDEKSAGVLGYSIELISVDQNHLINVRVKRN